MKNARKFIIATAVLLILEILTVTAIFAQNPPHPNGGGGPGGGDIPVGGGAPLDGGITFLVMLATAYASKKFFNKKQN